jgi:hypothetical protein
MIEIKSEEQWQELVTFHNAVTCKIDEISNHPNNAVAVEGANFGYIISKPDESGKRRFLARF